ncbi:MAG: GTPase Era [Bacteroidales bacterium]|nr:GTPase Era [Bacteroidales bacterium]
MEKQEHKSGFVNILGAPNVGKSTLMNAIMGENLSITNKKVQTTRHRIMGFLNHDDYQIVFSDTPGIIKDPSYKLHEAMMSFVESALEDADIFLYVTEIKAKILHPEIVEKIKNSNAKIIVVINKIDESNQEEVEIKVEYWKGILPEATIVPLSALHNFNTDGLLSVILRELPTGPAYFPKDQLTDKTMRFFIQELIREQVLIQYKKELPYSTEIVVEEYKEQPHRIDIKAILYVIRETQKMIIIGKGGQAIKSLGIEARKNIEEFTGKHIFLDLTVKVSKDWRENDRQLKKFGYNE